MVQTSVVAKNVPPYARLPTPWPILYNLDRGAAGGLDVVGELADDVA